MRNSSMGSIVAVAALVACSPAAVAQRPLTLYQKLLAAGNTGGPVAYPAASPAVLAVAAVGRFGEFTCNECNRIWLQIALLLMARFQY